MDKQELINYLNGVWPYLKLSVICKIYNASNPDNTIDYNNLRNTLNGTAPNRLSEDKLLSFYDFLTKEIFLKKFKTKSNALSSLQIKKIIESKTAQLTQEISEALEHGFSN